jgi:hypothetical protein
MEYHSVVPATDHRNVAIDDVAAAVQRLAATRRGPFPKRRAPEPPSRDRAHGHRRSDGRLRMTRLRQTSYPLAFLFRTIMIHCGIHSYRSIIINRLIAYRDYSAMSCFRQASGIGVVIIPGNPL